MARSNLKGIYNFCNPGAISHHEVLDMYKEIIDPNFRYTGFSVSEQDKILAGKVVKYFRIKRKTSSNTK